MAYINKKDTNGVKPLLQEGELAYDKYPAGGDVGRVYVGTGATNIALAKKAEADAAKTTADVAKTTADTHIARTDNPHATTKTQVGLGNVDNTSDLNKPVSTATQNALNLKANDNAVVKLTGNQTIDGVKTFRSSPIVPTPTENFQPVPLRSTNITVNVGAGQAYTTINQALEYLSGFYPMYKKGGITATINLKAGFVMAEQVLVSGIDLGWITIAGEDAETIITHTALTTNFNGHYPAFGVNKGGISPVIGQLFRFNVEKVGGNIHGLMTWGVGSSADVLPGKGFVGAGTNGIYANNGSTINAINANASNAGTNGIHAANSSTINATNANASNAGTYGILANESSTINAINANASNAGTNGILAVNSSTINAINANASNAGTNGIHAVNSSTINAINANASNAGQYGILALNGSTINANGADASGAGDVGIYAGENSTINASGANCSNAGTNGILALNGSTINAINANASNAGTYGIAAVNGSTINASGAIIQNQTTVTARILVLDGSHIEASRIITTGGTSPVFSQAINTLTASGIIYQ